MRIAINGFGRIGRITLRALLQRTGLEIIAINDLSDTRTLAHLFKYDSVHRGFQGDVSAENAHLIINGQKIRVFSEKDPSQLPWKEMNVDLVIESPENLLIKPVLVCICRQAPGRLLFLLLHPTGKLLL
jgi:glyceraldehyde 3-phosphate dehydrogenase